MEFDAEKYFLKSSSFFDFLTEKERTWVNSYLVRKEYKKGQILFKEGSYSKGVFIVVKGKVKIYGTNEEGKESIVYLYRKGDYFGYRPLLGDDPHPVSAAAVDQVMVLFIPADIFMEVLEKSNRLAKRLLFNLAKEFSVWIHKLTTFSNYSVKERVAISLLILNMTYQSDKTKNKRVVISLNRTDFASFVGTAKENLVRILRVLKDEKIISAERTNIIVLRSQALVDFLREI
jgi:CRP-like cAMP-binding protein